MPQLPLVCISEDRPKYEPAVRILLASLKKSLPEVNVFIFAPEASEVFTRWVLRYEGVHLERRRAPGQYLYYDVKPHALLTLMELGHSDILWIDSDIVVTAALRELLQSSDPAAFTVTEEVLGEFHDDQDASRARAWGLPVGRVFPCALNSGVIRVGLGHRALLERWRTLLNDDRYREAQRQLWAVRPRHFLSDQDALTALLSSAEFADTPVRILERGREIVQFSGPYGYTVCERLRHLFRGLPAFIHSLGYKPWVENAFLETAAGRFTELYLAVSPYTLVAKEYGGELEDASWLEAPSAPAAILRTLGLGVVPLAGLPLAVVADAMRLVKALRE